MSFSFFFYQKLKSQFRRLRFQHIRTYFLAGILAIATVVFILGVIVTRTHRVKTEETYVSPTPTSTVTSYPTATPTPTQLETQEQLIEELAANPTEDKLYSPDGRYLIYALSEETKLDSAIISRIVVIDYQKNAAYTLFYKDSQVDHTGDRMPKLISISPDSKYLLAGYAYCWGCESEPKMMMFDIDRHKYINLGQISDFKWLDNERYEYASVHSEADCDYDLDISTQGGYWGWCQQKLPKQIAYLSAITQPVPTFSELNFLASCEEPDIRAYYKKEPQNISNGSEYDFLKHIEQRFQLHGEIVSESITKQWTGYYCPSTKLPQELNFKGWQLRVKDVSKKVRLDSYMHTLGFKRVGGSYFSDTRRLVCHLGPVTLKDDEKGIVDMSFTCATFENSYD